MLRSQIGVVITGMAAYLVGAPAIAIVFQLIYNVYQHAWLIAATVIAPAVASLAMITRGQAFEHAPPQWVGLLVMLGYTVVFVAIGRASEQLGGRVAKEAVFLSLFASFGHELTLECVSSDPPGCLPRRWYGSQRDRLGKDPVTELGS